jgi:pilus assembly protein CpaE
MTDKQSIVRGNPIRVLIVPGSDPIGDWLASVLRAEEDVVVLGLVRGTGQIVESVAKLSPDLILVDIGSGILEQDDLFDRLVAAAAEASIIVLAVMNQMELVRQATLRGAHSFLLKPFSEAELMTGVRQANEMTVQRRASMAQRPSQPPGAEDEPVSRAETITVFSPKGGVGCTTIATNLAVALRMVTGNSTILVDGDLGFGDIDSVLDVTSTTSMSTLLAELGDVDDLVLGRSLVSHSSGIRILLAPPYFETADAIPAGDLKQLLARLTALSEGYLVVDSGSALDDRTLAVLDMTEHLIVVATPQVTALRDVQRFLEVLRLLHYDTRRTRLILNNSYHPSTLRVRDVERSLGHPIAQSIEYAPAQVTSSLNRGRPLIQEYPESPVSRSILALAQEIAGSGAVPKPRAGKAREAPGAKARGKQAGSGLLGGLFGVAKRVKA